MISRLDRYILAKTHRLVVDTAAALDAYDLAEACEQVNGFLDALNNWYIRRSRARFWAVDADDTAKRGRWHPGPGSRATRR